jgi:hypothetical protein
MPFHRTSLTGKNSENKAPAKPSIFKGLKFCDKMMVGLRVLEWRIKGLYICARERERERERVRENAENPYTG